MYNFYTMDCGNAMMTKCSLFSQINIASRSYIHFVISFILIYLIFNHV